MAKECKKFDALQTAPLDTEKRVTLRGTVKAIKEYPDNYSYDNDYIYKAIIELDGGQTVFGTSFAEVGDNVVFDAKLEKPKDFDGTFYYYKRPTKVKIL